MAGKLWLPLDPGQLEGLPRHCHLPRDRLLYTPDRREVRDPERTRILPTSRSGPGRYPVQSLAGSGAVEHSTPNRPTPKEEGE